MYLTSYLLMSKNINFRGSISRSFVRSFATRNAQIAFGIIDCFFFSYFFSFFIKIFLFSFFENIVAFASLYGDVILWAVDSEMRRKKTSRPRIVLE